MRKLFLEFSGQIMILIFISGLSSKVKIKVKSDVNPQCLQLRREGERKKEREGMRERGGLCYITLLSGP